MNQFKPPSTVDVTGSEKKISEAVEARLSLQSVRIDTANDLVQQTQKTASDNSETLHGLIVGIENLGESVKQLREEIKGWEEPEVPEEAEREAMELDAQLQEVPLAISGTSEQSQPPIQLPVVSTPISSTIPPVLSH